MDDVEDLKRRLIKEILASRASGRDNKIEVMDLRGIGCDALKKFLMNYQLGEHNKRYRVLLDNYTCFTMIKRAIPLLGGKLLDFGRESTYLFIEYEK
ncbi:hypothetical protein [Caldivirga maquilingensis]|uniref:Uncharacterized protein n=1 Tax=Caldivirga maquilingensis (strain ATCC 700844 / DSM 13496 / JCM 10307 / IC-167) TaxID=397948 RepID=A8MDB5_CALMQ|nr:hypothetical protein [Caldivirga maquilingensis]ABW01771.1 hypothetical protein Cmaq_0939 [Caldivirga maquilingensis IC-167]